MGFIGIGCVRSGRQSVHQCVRKLLAFAAVVLGTSAHAGVVFDWSPDATGSQTLIENFANNESANDWRQWSAERFTLGQQTRLSGMDLYSNPYAVDRIGERVTIRIWSSDNGTPGVLLFKDYSEISAQDKDGALSSQTLWRHFAELSQPFSADADVEYWISMTGTEGNIGSASYVGLDDGSNWLGREGDYPRSECNFCGDLIFRLQGETMNVAEPGSAVLVLSTCTLGLGVFQRSRRRQPLDAESPLVG